MVKVFGIQTVRNEADIVAVNVRHHLSLGLERMFIVDNGSTDGTGDELRELARDPRVVVRFDDGPYRQAEMLTELAREAAGEGADWVMSIDADEFWQPQRDDLPRILAGTAADILRVEVVNFIQRREQVSASPQGLLHAIRRVPLPRGPAERCQEMVEGRQIGFVEMMYPTKVIARATPGMQVNAGTHTVSGVRGEMQETDAIACLHLPLRARSLLRSKAEQGQRVEQAGWRPGEAWHVRRWQRMTGDEAIDAEWAANSYRGDWLDVYGEPHALMVDTRLRDAVRPWVAPSIGDRVRQRWPLRRTRGL
jgi:glycosyltransferase involved in cell wall biosynthesis